MFIRFSLIILVSFLLVSCGYVEVSKQNALINELDHKYNNKNLSYSSVNDYINYMRIFSGWYSSFNNEELNKLIDEVLANNLDIIKAKYNLQAAAHQLGGQKSALVPSLSAEAQTTYQKYNNKAVVNLKVKPESTVANLGLKASYEIDIWGKNYANYRGAVNKLKAHQEDYYSIKITMVASLMNLWVNLMAIREQEVILKNKIDYAQGMLNLQQSNYTGGNISITDLLQQESQILEFKDKLEEIKYNEKETLRSINILCGKEPLSNIVIKSNKLPKVVPFPGEYIDIKLLSNRPDVKSAFYTMIASKWDVKVANLNRLPSFNITPQIGLVNNNLSTLLDNWLTQVVLGGLLPIFNGGALYSKEKAAKFLSQAEVVNYKQVVFKSVNELKTAFDNEYKYKESIKKLQQQVNLIENASIQLQNKYLNGDADYIEYLISSNAVNDLKLATIAQKKDMLLNRIFLYRTLGIKVDVKDPTND